MQKIFITSSGTNVGKTLVTCALVKAYKKLGKKPHAMKPIISGFNANVVPNDIFHICEARGINYISESKKVNLYAFKKPMSPDMAARLGKEKAVDIKKLINFCKKAHSKTSHNFIETVGGVMVPINAKDNTLDWVAKCADKTILVAGSYLGSLSHTISAYQVLKASGKAPKLLVVTQNLDKNDALYIPVKETIKSLENFVSAHIIGVEKLAGSEPSKINKLSKKFIDDGISKFI